MEGDKKLSITSFRRPTEGRHIIHSGSINRDLIPYIIFTDKDFNYLIMDNRLSIVLTIPFRCCQKCVHFRLDFETPLELKDWKDQAQLSPNIQQASLEIVSLFFRA